MRPVVREQFFQFTVDREGFTPFMYCDKLNLVTTGVGNLIDSGPRNGLDTSASAMAPAMGLPWFHKQGGWTPKNPIVDDSRASASEIAANWRLVKLAGRSQMGGFAGYANLAGNDLSLSMDGVKELFATTLDRFERTLIGKYSGWESWPADAQLATLSMAWAMGPAFNFPAFKAAVDRLDFDTAAKESFFKGGGGTLDEREGRNKENETMFHTAAAVVRGGVDPDRLFFPGDASSPGVLPTGGGGIGVASVAGRTVGNIGIIGAGLGAIGWAIWQWRKR